MGVTIFTPQFFGTAPFHSQPCSLLPYTAFTPTFGGVMNQECLYLWGGKGIFRCFLFISRHKSKERQNVCDIIDNFGGERSIGWGCELEGVNCFAVGTFENCFRGVQNFFASLRKYSNRPCYRRCLVQVGRGAFRIKMVCPNICTDQTDTAFIIKFDKRCAFSQ